MLFIGARHDSLLHTYQHPVVNSVKSFLRWQRYLSQVYTRDNARVEVFPHATFSFYIAVETTLLAMALSRPIRVLAAVATILVLWLVAQMFKTSSASSPAIIPTAKSPSGDFHDPNDDRILLVMFLYPVSTLIIIFQSSTNRPNLCIEFLVRITPPTTSTPIA